jgi:hypothetical protein
MLRNILQSLGLARPPRRRYSRYGGGAALPILAALGWRYRDEIRSAFRNRFGNRNSVSGATTTTPGFPTPPPPHPHI